MSLPTLQLETWHTEGFRPPPRHSPLANIIPCQWIPCARWDYVLLFVFIIPIAMTIQQFSITLFTFLSTLPWKSWPTEGIRPCCHHSPLANRIPCQPQGETMFAFFVFTVQAMRTSKQYSIKLFTSLPTLPWESWATLPQPSTSQQNSCQPILLTRWDFVCILLFLPFISWGFNNFQ